MTVSFDYHDSDVLVTGGSNGLGLAIARGFHTAGARVTVTGRRKSADDYDTDLTGLRYRRCEMTERDTLEDLAASLCRLDVLVNNAGGNLARRDEWNPDVFEESVSANLFGTFRLSTACHPMLAASGGTVVNVGSMTSFLAVDVVPGYGAAKAAVVQLTKTLAATWAKDSIRVNAVAPGLVETNMTARMVADDVAVAPTIARTPMRRIGTPDDVVAVVLFLASDAAPFLTGQTVPVDGGYLVQG